jgi:methylenetetrahydrofolate--tRNA-(uracil-5-)-methyltransferase
MKKNPPIHVVGAGLAGSEIAYFLANRGHSVVLHEMRPAKLTEAHTTGGFAELVCSNSLKSQAPDSAPGILKSEMRALGSLVLQCAAQAEVPAGEALAVDREMFSQLVTQTLRRHPKIEIQQDEVDQPFSDGITVLATGPLTSQRLCQWLEINTDEEGLYFFDAIAPIVDASTLDSEKCFSANRYDKGEEAAYLNCPLTESEYESFIDALLGAEKVVSKSFEKFFQGCQPIEAIVAGGRESLRFGPMKPVGLTDPRTGKRPHAVLQLRPENLSRTAYNLVGFQTKLKYGEQKRVFSLIPALKNAEYLRLGSIHRNTYVCGPKVLNPDLSLKRNPKVYLAGQITGVEGYLESAACGLLTAHFIHQRLEKLPHSAPPIHTGMGALLHHLIGSDPKHYQPCNIHFGLLDQSWFQIPPQPKTSSQVGQKDWIRSQIAGQCRTHFEAWQGQTGTYPLSQGATLEVPIHPPSINFVE